MEPSAEVNSHMGIGTALLMQLTFNVTGSNILMPWTFATLGYVTGPILMVLIMFGTYNLQQLLNDVACALPAGSVHDLGGLCASAGGKRLGHAAALVQNVNLFLLCPIVLSYSASALQYIVHAEPGTPLDCNVYYCLFVIMPCLLISQVVRKFGNNTNLLALISVIGVAVQSILIMYVVLSTFHKYPDDAVPIVGEGKSQRNQGEYGWSNVITALGNFMYIFVPVFLNTELIAEMKEPQKINRVLTLAFIILICLYGMVGVIGALAWGDSVSDPISLQLPHAWPGIVVNALVLYSCSLDYLISCIICTGFVQRWVNPNFDRHDFSLSGCAQWFLYSLPTNVVALVGLTLVPNLQSLVGIITCLTITLGQWVIPAITSIAWLRRAEDMKSEESEDSSAASSESEDAPQRCSASRACLWCSMAFGVVALISLLASTVYAISTTKYGGADYFCVTVNR